MPRSTFGRRLIASSALGCTVLLASGCSWNGLNSLPLPGTVGTESDSYDITAVVPNVGTLTQNSPVMINDVTVGSIRKIEADENWNARVTIGLKAGTQVPKGTTAMVGQASLLGSQYLELAPPEGEVAKPSDLLQAGDVIPLSRGGRFPSTEQTLSTLSVVLNGGGLAQLQDITTELNAALGGNEGSLHDLIPHVEELVSTLDEQKGDIVAAMDGVDRLAGTVNEQSDVLEDALTGLDPATEVLSQEKDKLVDALVALGNFSSVADKVLNDSGAELRDNIKNVQPILAAVADAGNALPDTLTLLFTFPFPMETLFNAMRGDYTNLWDEVDLTGQRIERSLLLGSNVAGSLGGTGWAKGDDPEAGSGGGAGVRDNGDPFHPNMPTAGQDDESGSATPAPDGAVEQPGAASPGASSPGGPGAPGAAGAPGGGAAGDGEVDPVFTTPDQELFGPPASGDGL